LGVQKKRASFPETLALSFAKRYERQNFGKELGIDLLKRFKFSKVKPVYQKY